MGTMGPQRRAHARNNSGIPPNKADRWRGRAPVPSCKWIFGFVNIPCGTTLPRVRCICNEVWEWCPICILNRPTDTAVHAVHAVSAAERAQHSRTQPDRPCLLFHYQIGLLGLCRPFTRKLPNRCVAKQHGNVKCVEGNCLDLYKLTVIIIKQTWQTWENEN